MGLPFRLNKFFLIKEVSEKKFAMVKKIHVLKTKFFKNYSWLLNQIKVTRLQHY